MKGRCEAPNPRAVPDSMPTRNIGVLIGLRFCASLAYRSIRLPFHCSALESPHSTQRSRELELGLSPALSWHLPAQRCLRKEPRMRHYVTLRLPLGTTGTLASALGNWATPLFRNSCEPVRCRVNNTTTSTSLLHVTCLRVPK